MGGLPNIVTLSLFHLGEAPFLIWRGHYNKEHFCSFAEDGRGLNHRAPLVARLGLSEMVLFFILVRL